MKSNTTKIIIIVIAVFVVGLLARKLFFAKKPKHLVKQTSTTTTHTPSYRFINPLTDSSETKTISTNKLAYLKPKIETYIKETKRKHPDLYIAYYFRDLSNNSVVGVNENDLFSPASLMKVPIMITVLKEAQSNPNLLRAKILFEKKHFVDVDEESGFEKKDGEYYTVEELIRHMIAYSDNAAALILMQYIGMDKIAKTENSLNLQVDENADINTNFVAVNRYAAVFRILYNASYLNKEMSERALGFLSQAVYKKGIREAVPAQYPIAQKYGERDSLDKAGKRNTLQLHQFGIVYHPNKPYLIGMMTRGATKEVKERIIYDLANITHSEVEE